MVPLERGLVGSAIITAARRMQATGLVAGSLGNVSQRITADAFLVTPTRHDYHSLAPEDLARVAIDGSTIAGEPSREWQLHAAVYRARPDISSVVHTHSVHATAWSFLGEPLVPKLEDIDYYDIGEIRTTAPASAGSAELASVVVDALADRGAALVGGHGVVTVGSEPALAVTIAEIVERQATVAWLVRANRSAGLLTASSALHRPKLE